MHACLSLIIYINEIESLWGSLQNEEGKEVIRKNLRIEVIFIFDFCY